MPTEPSPANALTSAALETMMPALLIEIILQQQQAIAELRSEIDGLKGQRDSDSKTSSKPPSTDLLKKSEQPSPAPDPKAQKRKPGGQPGHEGKTRKGFSRIDRTEILRPEQCPSCFGRAFEIAPVHQVHHQVARSLLNRVLSRAPFSSAMLSTEQL